MGTSETTASAPGGTEGMPNFTRPIAMPRARGVNANLDGTYTNYVLHSQEHLNCDPPKQLHVVFHKGKWTYTNYRLCDPENPMFAEPPVRVAPSH
jgi:hypothetical protein